MSSDRLDVIIFGATGYTGKYAVIEGVKLLKGLTWGVAGRNKEKLESVLAEVGKKVDQDLSKIPIVIADVGDEKSILEMTKKAKIIVNCCGPYRHYGEQVVKACVESGTHHVDVSGEPQYMETMQLKYNQQAEEKKIYIVSACGFDSIPADVGLNFLEEEFNGTVNSVETYIKSHYANDDYKPSGAAIHYGTWESAVYGLAHARELGGIRRQLFKTRLPRFTPQITDRGTLHKSDKIDRWCLPFPGSDRSVVQRSQRHFFDNDKKRPVQMRPYISFDSLPATLAVIFVGAIFGILAKFSFGRKLLLEHPKFFSFGSVSHEGPSEERNENSILEMFFYGEGWKEKQAEPTDQFETPINKKITTKVECKNPGYGSTCIALLIAATTILKESDKMPGVGGVLPPGAAFKKTNMISELKKNGYKFEVVKVEE